MKVTINDKGQAIANKTIKMNSSNFTNQSNTQITWLGGAGVHINSHGTNLMIDPVLRDFDMPLLYDIPILTNEIDNLDSILITHIDNDHFSIPTCKDLVNVCKSYHTTNFVSEKMKENQIPGTGHNINDEFNINNIKVKLTPAKHNWQNYIEKYNYREWLEEDYCGFYLNTPDGSIYLPGDSKLLQSQLEMPKTDLILFDFSDNSWHISFDDAIKLANNYPDSKLLCIHWGSVDAPEMNAFNGNPNDLFDKIINPERILVLAPGKPYIL